MPSTPTTKSQVQAYRFVLRRMQSALVRKDAVMLHDPMRTHQRSVVAGMALAAVALLGFLIFGVISPKASPPSAGEIVMAQPSGGIYVAVEQNNALQLIPMMNMASAQLLQMRMQGGASAGLPEPSFVSDDVLADITIGSQLTGIPGAPEKMPDSERRIDPLWTVCDWASFDDSLANPAASASVETSVLAGVHDLPGRALAEDEVVVARSEADGEMWAIYRPDDTRAGSRAVVRAWVDPNHQVNQATLASGLREPHLMTEALLNSIPTVDDYAAPDIPDQGLPADRELVLPDGNAAGIGTVVAALDASGQGRDYYVVLNSGYQDIPEGVAELIRWSQGQAQAEVPLVERVDITRLGAAADADLVEIRDLPSRPLRPVPYMENPVTCFAWNGSDDRERTELRVGEDIELRGADAAEDDPLLERVRLGADNAADYFFMPPGNAAVVRSTTSEGSFQSGPIHFVSDRGVRYAIPDMLHVTALGLLPEGSTLPPAPEPILRLLPAGPRLDQNNADLVFDYVPFDESGDRRLEVEEGAGEYAPDPNAPGDGWFEGFPQDG
ncbi:type VII secretion protein EccB [Actinoalloteichus spitiensis]|uniref:type VII secretion protein EccB n=1 Tax=Actinoalloteichus spitiensis TaxID=252394 RepID=UPI0009FD4C85|nr:type VII secretion protein EccB [Actinoalloteichus spitiensis]